jgi:hypothetical protein
MFRSYALSESRLREAVESRRVPWLDLQQSMRLIAGVSELQGIGNALNKLPAFGEELATTLRTSLGDCGIRLPDRRRFWPMLRSARIIMTGLGLIMPLRTFQRLPLKRVSKLRVCGDGHPPWLIATVRRSARARMRMKKKI